MENNKKNKKIVIISFFVILALICSLGLFIYMTSVSESNKTIDNKTYNKGKKIDLNKCLDDSDSVFKLDSNKIDGLSISYDDNKVYLNIDASKFSNNVLSTNEKYEISGISKKDIKEYLIDGIGQDYKGTIIFFLTKDGTIKYFKLFKTINNNLNLINNKFNVEDVYGLKNIIKLYGASVTLKKGIGGYHTTLASLNDGSFYNLAKEIDKIPDTSKCLNDNETNFSNLNDTNYIDGLSVSYNNDDVYLNIDNSKTTNNTIFFKSGAYKVNNISEKEIKKVFIGGIGQDMSGTIITFLTNDGNIKYFRLFMNLNSYNTLDGTFNAISVDNLKNINNLYSANAYTKGEGATGYTTILASLKDGSFYNLSKVINIEETKEIDLTKCLNDNKEMNYSNLRQDTGDYGANVTYSGDTVNIEINNSKLSNNAASIKDGVYKVNGITKSEIKKYYVSGIGQDYTGDTIFFLTNNNEVKYVKLINSYNLNINNGSFTALKLNGISNVIDFYTSDATYKNNMLGGHMTVLASLQDGSFYNLEKNIN